MTNLGLQDALGPSWPGIPANACDLNTMLAARWLIASDADLVAMDISAGAAAGKLSALQIGALRHALPDPESELAVWAALLGVCRWQLGQHSTSIAQDRAALVAASTTSGGVGGGGSSHAGGRGWLLFRIEKKRLLVLTIDRLTAAIATADESCRDGCMEAGSIRTSASTRVRTNEATACEADGGANTGDYGIAGLTAAFRAQAGSMPTAVRAVLVDGATPASVSTADLFRALRLTEPAYRAAIKGAALSAESAVLQVPGALSPAACRALRLAVDERAQAKVDTVDGCPDHQLNLDRSALEQLVGTDAVAALWSLPAAFSKLRGVPALGAGFSVETFVRRYSAVTRPWIPFHCDSATITCNVALADDAEGDGRLVAIYDNQVRAVNRREGEATIHASTLMHGVTAMRSTRNVRYSLILFLRAQH